MKWFKNKTAFSADSCRTEHQLGVGLLHPFWATNYNTADSLWQNFIEQLLCVSHYSGAGNCNNFLVLNWHFELQPGKQENLSPPQRGLLQRWGDPANQASSQGQLQSEVCGLFLPWPAVPPGPASLLVHRSRAQFEKCKQTLVSQS